MGKTIPHGYIISGVPPLQIAFSTLAGALLWAGVEIDDQMHDAHYYNFAINLSASKAQLVRDT